MKNELLIEEDSFQIAWHCDLARKNAAILQAVNEIYPIENESEARQAASNIDAIIRHKFAEHKNFKSLAMGFDVLAMPGLVWPSEISALKAALDNLRANLNCNLNHVPGTSGFQFVVFTNGWRIDRNGLETYCQKYYKFTTPEKLKVANDLCNALNAIPDLTEGQKINHFGNDICRYSAGSQKFEINKNYLRQ